MNSTYAKADTQQITADTFPVLWSYGASEASQGMRVLAESSGASASGWEQWIGQSTTAVHSVRRYFWVWTRYFDYGVWALTTVGVVNADGTIGPAIGAFDALSDWTGTPISGETEAGTWWMLLIAQEAVESSVSASTTKPLIGMISWRESACVGTVTHTYTVKLVDGWYYVNEAVTGSIYDSITDTTTEIAYTSFPAIGTLISATYIIGQGGTVVVEQEIDWSSEEEDESVYLGKDDIKLWRYFVTED